MSKPIPDNLAFPVPYTLQMQGNGEFVATWEPVVPTPGLPDMVRAFSQSSGITALERLREQLVAAGVL